MAWTVTNSYGRGTSSSLTATEPTGAASGDLLIMSVYAEVTGAITGPTGGWTTEQNQVGTGQFRGTVYSIIRGGSAPNLGASWTGSVFFNWSVVRISWSGDTMAVDTSAISASSAPNPANPDPPSASATNTDDLALAIGFSFAGTATNNTGFTAPTGYTISDGTSGTHGDALGAAYKALAASGAENPGAFSNVNGGAGNQCFGVTLLAKHTAAGGGTTVKTLAATGVGG